MSHESTRRRHSRALGCLTDVVVVVAVSIIVLFVITNFVAQPYEVEQESMSPTFAEGQYVFVDRLTPRFDGYSRGDIVVFSAIKRAACSDPTGVPLPGAASYIKRVIGEPGDLIELRDGDVFVNGAMLSEPYAPPDETGPPGLAWVVPPGRLFVMGDNRPESLDSRSDMIGPICINDVIGRVVVRYWPLNKLGILQTPTYQGIPATPGPVPEATTVP